MRNKKIEKEIEKIVDKYKDILLLQRHTFEFKYPTENRESVAECVFNYPYLNVTINYGEKLIKRFEEKKDITSYIIHEMCHIITDPLYAKATSRWASHDEVKDERELLTDYITNIVVKNNL